MDTDRARGGHESLNFEVKYEDVISLKDGKCTRRIARFLRPVARDRNEAAAVPKIPLLSEISASDDREKCPAKITFRGWTSHPRGWKQWVDRLALKHAGCWNQTSICDAILGSMYEVQWNQDLVLGIVEFWCPETNTFVFPWGEATITLEDVMILGGFAVTGELISSAMTEEESQLVVEMNNQRLILQSKRGKKASFCGWLDHFKEGNSECEHVGFLALWLSRHVFPSLPVDTISNLVLPIAAKLSLRRKLSLAPAVLASLYEKLTLLRGKLTSTSESVIIMAWPFQLLLLWAFEHFPTLAPNLPKTLKPGEPRVARWHKLSIKLTVAQVKSALVRAENFEWRPYAADYENWRHLSYYKEREQLLSSSTFPDEEMESYFQCLWSSELVGLDCKQMYQPQRVAMQFGMDQDLPGNSCALNLALENLVFFVPPRSFLPGVSERYYNWWKDSMSAREGAIKDILLQSENVTMHEASASDETCEDRAIVNVSITSEIPTKPVNLSRDLPEPGCKSYDSSVSSQADDLRASLNSMSLENSNVLSQSPEENCGSIIVIGSRKRELAGKYGYDQDEKDADEQNAHVFTGERKAKRKAGGSAGDPIVIVGEMERTTKASREGRESSNEDTGKSIRNPILIC